MLLNYINNLKYRLIHICTHEIPKPSYVTSFILAALKDGVRMLRTLFQRSFLNMSRQSVMGLVAKRIVCIAEQEKFPLSKQHFNSNVHVLLLL